MLLAHNCTLTKEEIRRLVKLSSNGQNEEVDVSNQIDYVQLSKNLGLHKNAITLMQGGGAAIAASQQLRGSQDQTRRLMQQLNLNKKARGAVKDGDDLTS